MLVISVGNDRSCNAYVQRRRQIRSSGRRRVSDLLHPCSLSSRLKTSTFVQAASDAPGRSRVSAVTALEARFSLPLDVGGNGVTSRFNRNYPYQPSVWWLLACCMRRQDAYIERLFAPHAGWFGFPRFCNASTTAIEGTGRSASPPQTHPTAYSTKSARVHDQARLKKEA